jgi:hypothetical protein
MVALPLDICERKPAVRAGKKSSVGSWTPQCGNELDKQLPDWIKIRTAIVSKYLI